MLTYQSTSFNDLPTSGKSEISEKKAIAGMLLPIFVFMISMK